MYDEGVNPSDAAAIAYFKVCLEGRARRISLKWKATSQREQLLLNQPNHGDHNEDYLSYVSDRTVAFDQRVVDKLWLEAVLSSLTPKERHLIERLYAKDQTVKQICQERNISKNTVMKTKRNALTKLQKCMGE